MIDLLAELRRIQSANNLETFDRTTDSLEAISEALGIGPSVGLWMFGVCAAGMAPSTNTIVTDNLGTDLPDDVFNNEFWMQVIHNASAPGAAPEREWRRITNFVGAIQTFTVDAFSANVEPGDLLAIVHESVLPVEILGFGTLTVSSTTVPADNGRAALYAWENDNYFNGCLLMPTEGDCRFQPRRIVDFTRVGGIFTLDPNNPFSQLPGTVDYIIIGDQTEFTPAADGVNSRIPADVLGNKASTAIYAKDNVSDIIRYLKGLMDSTITAWGVADAGSGAGLVRDAARTEADDWWNGQTILMLTGAATGQKRPISDFLAASDDIIPAPVFDAAVGAGDIYIILAHYNQIVPRTADNVSSALTSEVVGRKDDSAVYAPDNVSSLVRYLKGLMGALGAFTAAENLKAILGAYTAAAPLKAAIDKMLFPMDFWSNPQEEVAVTDGQTTPGLPSVTIADLPATATIVRAIAMFKFRIVENTNQAENSLDCAAIQPIQVDDSVPTGFVTAIDFVDEMYKIGAGPLREGGDVIIGDNDIAARVDGNDTYSFQWLNAKAHLANLQFNDVQCGLRIWYSV